MRSSRPLLLRQATALASEAPEGGELDHRLAPASMGLATGAGRSRFAHEQGWRPFHWEVEFPEVFARDNPGFDAIVGNPPFAGKNTISAWLGTATICLGCKHCISERTATLISLRISSVERFRSHEWRCIWPDRNKHDRARRYARSGLAPILNREGANIYRATKASNGQTRVRQLSCPYTYS